jgi:hypothetical protein
MSKTPCILLSIALVTTGVRLGTASAQGLFPVRGDAARVDTARTFEAGDSLRRPPAGSLRTVSRSSGAGGKSVGPAADPNLYGADGNVAAIARSGNTLYIAGSFRSVGENSGGFVPVDAGTGEALRTFPKVAGFVHAIAPDGSGGWYIGGEFSAVGGKPRSCLAQIRADGSVTDWNPGVTDWYVDAPTVLAIAVRGDRVYVGGGFLKIGGLPRHSIGCIDAQTGGVLDWNPGTDADGEVYALAVHDSSVFVGGFFYGIGGQPRSHLAAVDAAVGSVLPWQADATGSVWALMPRGDSLFVAGEFGGMAGGLRSMIAVVDCKTAQLRPFDARAHGLYVNQYLPTPQIRAMALNGDTLYVAGNFTDIGGQVRSSIAALNIATGDALAWAPDTLAPRYQGFPPPLVVTLAVGGGAVYLGGWFETVGGVSHPGVAALTRDSAHAMAWDPKPDAVVDALALKGDAVYLGGDLSFVGEWSHRAGLAAIDVTTGAVKPWNPNPDGTICTAVVVSGDRVFVSGDFGTIGGDPQPRSYLAALDTLNGEVKAWSPGANSLASAMLLAGDTLYVGGEFTEVGGLPRNYLAAIDAKTGAVTDWAPDADYPVLAMTRSGETIYASGLFDHVGGLTRHGIAAVDAGSGAVTPWNPDTDNSTVDALLVSGNKIYVGGAFGQIGGQSRRSIAALELATGTATSWQPTLTNWDVINPRVRALAMIDSVLFIGGDFGSVGGQPRICLASVDTSTGLPTEWDPGTDGLVWSLASDGNTIYAGGGFTRASGFPAVGLAAFSLPANPDPTPLSFRLVQSIPNPARSDATIRFVLPTSSVATLTIYDIEGRRIATPLRHATLNAGEHVVPVAVSGWKPGIYLYRLEAGNRAAARKMMVVH